MVAGDFLWDLNLKCAPAQGAQLILQRDLGLLLEDDHNVIIQPSETRKLQQEHAIVPPQALIFIRHEH